MRDWLDPIRFASSTCEMPRLRRVCRKASMRRSLTSTSADSCSPSRRNPLADPIFQPGGRDIEIFPRGLQHQHLAAPGRSALRPGTQLLHNPGGDARCDIPGRRGDLETNAHAAETLARVEEQRGSHVIARRKPEAANQAPQRMRLADVHVLELRGPNGDPVSRLSEIGEPEIKITIANARPHKRGAREIGEQRFQRELEVRPHPVRKFASRDDQRFERHRLEVRDKQLVQSNHFSHVSYPDKER